ncbi:formate--phosphoribosylaminoimidazolecarboxamide ligase [Candidatus Gottesmanbacteria bacterium]|nr:formate--phosphoribosylaminoimidazolecarboxamide ligase [Candidatus Gottesmanbacteria bacterium]
MKYTIATLASHSCLQILKGAKDEGFETLAIALSDRVNFYKRFKFIDKIVSIKSYSEFYKLEKNLAKEKVIFVPHGSITAYLGSDYAGKIKMSHFGNKNVLSWEIDREKQMEWLQKAGLKLPKIFKNPQEISSPVIIKLFGAKGGSGYFLAKDKAEFLQKVKKFRREKYIIQQYMVGTPVYLQYFYSPLKKEIELLGIDRRYESNVDGLSRLPPKIFDKFKSEPSFTVIGNFPIVIRESLLPEVYKMGEKIVAVSKKLISLKGLYGPFCLETIVTPNQVFYAIEISCRIVAGTNLYINGSPYTDLQYGEPMSTGRRIAVEIKEAIKQKRLGEILD